MGRDGPVTEIYTGNRRFTGRCDFTQGGSGMGIQVVKDSQIWYVDKNKTGPAASGDGLSWNEAFLTVTEGLAALEDYDTLFIGPGNYDETAKLTLGPATGSLTGVKIFGFGNGMQWGEGSTCIRNVIATTSDILDISNCHALEIAGINFVQIGAYDAINFTALNYSCHIHDCGFIGDQGAGTALYGLNAMSSSGPDLYVHDCRFMGWKTAGLVMGNQRNVIKNNLFIVPASGIGISFDGGAASSFNVIADNEFLGANSSDYGIYSVGGSRGNFMISGNNFANFASATGYGILLGTGDYNCVENYRADAAGAVTVVDPEQ